MRFRLTLQNPTSYTKITWNYNYLVMAWIYKKLEAADPDYANFLHQEGYQSDENRKKFKYLTFSPFHFNKGKSEFAATREAMIIKGEEFYLDLSFYMDKAAEKFIVGVFRDQVLELFNDRFRAKFQIGQITTLPEPEFSSSMIFHADAPMLVELRTEEQKYGDYLPPDHPDFGGLLALNLSDKYFNATGNRVEKEEIKFELLSDPKKIKSRMITIKEKSNEATELKGYHNFDFRLTAPMEVLKCGYYSGLGRFNTEGLGMVRV
jgi:CRISPR-associated endoribonuclease Cas6